MFKKDDIVIFKKDCTISVNGKKKLILKNEEGFVFSDKVTICQGIESIEVICSPETIPIRIALEILELKE